MSAYVVDLKTILRVVWAASKVDAVRGVPVVESVGTPPLGLTLVDLANRLWGMNTDAVNQRYNESNPPPVVPFASDVLLMAQGCGDESPIVEIKAVQCLLYQCSEGDVPKCVLYAWLRRLAGELAIRYVQALPEYSKAPGWG